MSVSAPIQKIFAPKKVCVKKSLGKKNLSKKSLVQNIFVQKFLDRNKFKVQKEFGIKNVLFNKIGPNFFLTQNNLQF